MKLYELLNELSYEIIQGSTDKDIKNLCWDSRRIKEESLFIAVKNKNVDRHVFIKEAIKKGAIALIVENEVEDIPKDITIIKVKNSKKAMAIIANKYYGEPSKNFNLIGVTGTNGKTSVTYFISKIFNGLGRKSGIIGTVENSIGGKKLTVEKLNPTTPDSIELQESFYEMLKEGVEHVAMEVTSSALGGERVYKCDFNIGVFTNFTQDHLEEHGTMENYKKAKMKLFKMCKKGIINADDSIAEEIKENATCDIVTYGIDKEADFRAFDIKYSATGVNFSLNYKGLIKNIVLNVPGKFSVYNALAAISACYLSGLNLDEIILALQGIHGVPGRFEGVQNNEGILAVVDYAHSPDSLENILTSLREISKGNIITIFGCGGDRDKTKRPIMGEIAGNLSHFCIITSDNPRRENPMTIINNIEEGMIKTQCEYKKIENRREAIFMGLRRAKPGDAVIIAGKGHETYQIIGDETIHFDDKEVVREFFEGLKR
ncbi:UDP-N-acetylmuramoyl-L-alanyl-D-glutamate--2,6-diaminopimelate ligase [Clostridium sp. MSJ-4]|uniref:UDP-N-acetylmuramoyl-L-alanyl-D-glutamate--2,6-diaminopimelate ligase n=1 Tax=Clostridium simiarum TaxID=2841506 RepID=A0ABS6F3N3_9CLOT|nr:UDP-N-acetylmuramoyl-L-alanyl-D-glutamate--2,6-diaminopimelate ligase [Clostridium simiarum]MBU5593114.1 UDP-N-acetylmuramoyl-L-alanyl-D-glutamate--2,6-diaminopimelate ligase [Clostridium simiarum]